MVLLELRLGWDEMGRHRAAALCKLDRMGLGWPLQASPGRSGSLSCSCAVRTGGVKVLNSVYSTNFQQIANEEL